MNFYCAKKLQKNVIIGNLNRAHKISSNLEQAISIIKRKYLTADYPNSFINYVINNFDQDKEYFLIPPTLFEERK